MDHLTAAQRSAHMAKIKRSNTKPELQVRRLLHRLGYRFRVQLSDVPGRPDIAFPRKKKAIFVHGCFWHAHDGCPDSRVPKTKTEFWQNKFGKNRERDARLLQAARDKGWECLVIWECDLRNEPQVADNLVSYLGPPLTSNPDRS